MVNISSTKYLFEFAQKMKVVKKKNSLTKNEDLLFSVYNENGSYFLIDSPSLNYNYY
jgi:hypothetical protein